LSNPTGILNYNKLNDRDKSYIVKLSGTIIAAILYGVIGGANYANEEITGQPNGRLGFLIWLLVTLALAQVIKMKFNLADMTDMQIFRHGVFVGFLSYLFFWIIFFNVVVCNVNGALCVYEP